MDLSAHEEGRSPTLRGGSAGDEGQHRQYSRAMNWLQRLFGMDEPRAPKPIDPTTVVHVATLPLWQTPLVVKGLEQRNITATFAEMSSPKYTMIGIPTARIYVVQRDRAVAERIISELTANPASSRRRRVEQ